MARPIKTGLEYFSIYVDFFNDIKVKRLIRACKSESIAVLINLNTKIYDTGYYLDFDEDISFIIADELALDEDYVNQTILKMMELNMFDYEVFRKFGIITSTEIQTMFLMAVKRRSKVVIINDIWLVDETDIYNENTKVKPEFERVSIHEAEMNGLVSVANNLVNVAGMLTTTPNNKQAVTDNGLVTDDNNPINVDESTQIETQKEIQTETETEINIENKSLDRPNGLSATADGYKASNNSQSNILGKENPSPVEDEFIRLAKAYPNEIAEDEINETLKRYKQVASTDGFMVSTLINRVKTSQAAQELTLKEFLERHYMRGA